MTPYEADKMTEAAEAGRYADEARERYRAIREDAQAALDEWHYWLRIRDEAHSALLIYWRKESLKT